MVGVADEMGSEPGRRIVVIGSANADLITLVRRRPGAGETVLGSDLQVLPGGKGANQAVAAGLLGGQVSFVGCVGQDSYGDLLLASLRDAGVDLAHTRRVDAPTGVALITVTPDGDNSIIVSPGANGRVTKADVDGAAPLLRHAAVVVLQMELPPAVVAYAARRGVAAGARVVLNLAPAAPVDDDVIGLCDPLVVNEHEAAFLLGDPTAAEVSDAAAMAERLRAQGARSVVITVGAAGAVVAQAAGVTHVSAPRVNPVDTTGAGDAFTGALAWRLACGDSLEDAAAFAVRVGSYAVTSRGAQTSFPRKDAMLP